MKTLFIILFLFVTAQISFGQTKDCNPLHTGTFKLVSKTSGTTIIKRTEKLQVEENADMGVKMIFDITWVDECTYELRAKEVVKGDPVFMGKKGDFMTVRIKEIKAKSYIAVTTANFADFVLESEIEIL